VPVGLRRRRRKESRLERARREGNVGERAREREAVAREESGRQRVRPGFAYQTIREIALASLYRSVRLQAAGRALSWRSVRLSEASKKKGGYSMCVSVPCVCVSTHDPRDRTSVTTCWKSFAALRLNIKGCSQIWIGLSKTTREIKGFRSDQRHALSP